MDAPPAMLPMFRAIRPRNGVYQRPSAGIGVGLGKETSGSSGTKRSRTQQAMETGVEPKKRCLKATQINLLPVISSFLYSKKEQGI